MGGDVVNLRNARKRRDRADKQAAAERNRFEYGRTKAERSLVQTRNDKATRDHQASRREPNHQKPNLPEPRASAPDEPGGQ